MESSENVKKLTAKEEQFCQHYVMWLNSAKAAELSGYSKKTARTIGSKLLTKVDVKERIDYLKANLAETCGVTANRIIEEHKKIAFSDGSKFRSGWMTLKEYEDLTSDEKACIKEISTKQTTRYERGLDGKLSPVIEEWVKIVLYDKQKSLDSITAMIGANAPIKSEVLLTGNLIKWGDSEIKI